VYEHQLKLSEVDESKLPRVDKGLQSRIIFAPAVKMPWHEKQTGQLRALEGKVGHAYWKSNHLTSLV
jgi:hypothetical protein